MGAGAAPSGGRHRVLMRERQSRSPAAARDAGEHNDALAEERAACQARYTSDRLTLKQRILKRIFMFGIRFGGRNKMNKYGMWIFYRAFQLGMVLNPDKERV